MSEKQYLCVFVVNNEYRHSISYTVIPFISFHFVFNRCFLCRNFFHYAAIRYYRASFNHFFLPSFLFYLCRHSRESGNPFFTRPKRIIRLSANKK
ncbi:MAG TPA: hypothetical protein PLS19_12415, partial [bacterium]|nr:hypothetical protein [bacterium]